MTALTTTGTNNPSADYGSLFEIIDPAGLARRRIPFLEAVAKAQQVQYNAPVNTDVVSCNDQTTTLILDPAGTIAGATVNMPAHPYNGQIVRLTSTHTVTTLTHQVPAGSTATLNGALTTIGAGITTHGSWIYYSGTDTWYALGYS